MEILRTDLLKRSLALLHRKIQRDAMSIARGDYFARRQERRLMNAGRLYRKGRSYVVWMHGLLFFGGSLFILCNALDYFVFDNGSPFKPVDLIRLGGYLVISVFGGYLYGLRVWRNLDRLMGSGPDSSI
jgi:hypothetical protein